MKIPFVAITVLFISLFISSYSIAQNIKDKGIKAGVALSDWYGKGADEFSDNFSANMSALGFTDFNVEKKFRFGLSIDAFFNMKLSKIIQLQTELIYTMKGVKFSGGGFFQGYDVDTQIIIKTDYLEVPLLLNLSPPGTGMIKPFVIFGPSVAFKTSSKLKVKVKSQGSSDSDESDFNNIKGTDIALIFGGGFKISNGVLVDIRYCLGLNSINDASDQIEIKNRNIIMTMGFYF